MDLFRTMNLVKILDIVGDAARRLAKLGHASS